MEQGEPSTKRQKTNEERDESENAVTGGVEENYVASGGADGGGGAGDGAGAVAIAIADVDADADAIAGADADTVAVPVPVPIAAPNIHQIADILKLDIDCFEEVFDYSSLSDLIRVGATCKRMQQVAGYCFGQNYSAKSIECKSILIGNHFNDATHLAPFIRKIKIFMTHEGLQCLWNVQTQLRRLKQIKIKNIRLTQSKIDCMKEALSKIEVLRVYECELNFDEIIACCLNLRRLKVEYCLSDFMWLDQKCPTLECFKYIPFQPNEAGSERIPRFLEQNPNIRKFATTADHLWANREFMKNSSAIKLDELVIRFYHLTDDEFIEHCQLLHELFERGIYKRLHLYVWETENQQLLINQLVRVNGLVKLSIESLDINIISTLNNVEEFDGYFYERTTEKDVESVANNLLNLKRLYFDSVCFDDLVPFIRRAPALEKIKFKHLGNDGRFSNRARVIDLVKLNRERQQLPNARKITMYVDENIYLATKWALKETNFDLIHLKRKESFEWDRDFGV